MSDTNQTTKRLPSAFERLASLVISDQDALLLAQAPNLVVDTVEPATAIDTIDKLAEIVARVAAEPA